MSSEKVFITSSNGKKLAAVIHSPSKKTGRLAILCPGYLDTKDYDHLVRLAEALAEQGYAVVRFDPIGTWESEGSILDYTTSQQLADVKSVLEYMLGKEHYDQVLLGGHSRGGMISILYAARDPRISVVLAVMSPYSLIRTVNKDKIEKWKREGFKTSLRDIPKTNEKREFRVPYSDIEDAQKYNVLDEASKLHIPLILVAGELDDVILPADVKLIFDKANEPKRMVVIDGIGHDYRHNITEVEKVNDIILKLLT